MRKLILYVLLSAAPLLLYSQNCFRIRTVKLLNDKETPFLLPPKAKIASESFLTRKKKILEYKSGRKFKYAFILIKDLKPNYGQSIEKVRSASYIRSKSKSVPNRMNDFVTSSEKPLGSFAHYFEDSKHENIVIRIDYDILLASDNFKKYYLELHEKLAELNETHKWGDPDGSISPEIVKKIFELTPVPASEILGQFLSLTDANKTFLMVDPQIWLQVDNAVRLNPYSADQIKNNAKLGDFWTYNLIGQTTIRYYRDVNGSIMQYPVFPFSSTTKMPENNLNIDNGSSYAGHLNASTADMQFSQSLKKKKYIYLFQTRFRENNYFPTVHGSVNDFYDRTSQLLFNDKLDQKFLNTVNSTTPDPRTDTRTKYAIFGFRNIINPVIPVLVNNTQVIVNFSSTLRINKNQGIVPQIAKIEVCRLHKGKYKRIKHFSDDLLLLPNDKIRF